MKVAGKVEGYQNEFENMVVDLVSTYPTSPLEGQIVWNTTDNKLAVYDGTQWIFFVAEGNSPTFDDLYVLGNSELGRHVRIHDEMVTLNYGESGAGINQWGTNRAGIEIDRGTLPMVSLFFDEASGRWSLTNDGTTTEQIMTFDPVSGTGVANDYFLRLDGGNTPTANISWNNNRITDLAEPINLHDAANKLFAIKMAIVLG